VESLPAIRQVFVRATSTVLVLLVVLGAGVARADDVPRVDLDRTLPRASDAPTRVRWFLQPDGADLSTLQRRATDDGVDLVARLDRFGGDWVIEADAARAAEIESTWSALGTLRRDVSGTPALAGSTALVGVRSFVWDELEYQGDPVSTIAILDSGCDTAHDDLGDPRDDDIDEPPLAGDASDWFDVQGSYPSDLRLRVAGWHDVTDDLPDAVGPWDYHFHGTALASAGFGGGRVDGDGRGVAPGGRLAIVKTWNFEDRWEVWASDLLLGFDWVLDHADRLRIRACLVGATWAEDPGFGPAIDALAARGIAVVAPAGNEPGADMGYPARLPGVIGVGASDAEGAVATYSSWAPGDEDPGTLDLIAPGGSRIDPDARLRVADNEPQDAYAFRFGTSLAAAHVAGTISVLSETMASVSHPWRADASQVSWITDVLRATAAEVAAAESSAVFEPRVVRTGADRFAGHGLLQVRAAVDAVRNVVWPGDDVPFTLDAPTEGPAVWAARVPVSIPRPLGFRLQVGDLADFDLVVYRETDAGLDPVGASTRAGVGLDERVELATSWTGWAVVVVRRIEGTGLARLRVENRAPVLEGWPLELSARQVTSPTGYDFGNDGSTEVVTVNNLQAFPDGHAFHVVTLAGEDVGIFPEQFFTPGRAGELTEPAVGRLGPVEAIVAGSEFGQVLAVDAAGDLLWIRTVSLLSTTSPVLVDEGPDARIAVGTSAGIAILDPSGQVVQEIPIGGPVEVPPAAGDLDGDGRDELLVADVVGNVTAVETDGTVLPGWPVALDGRSTAPVLLGTATGTRVDEVALVGLDGGGAWLHRWRTDGSRIGATPITLDTDALPVTALSPLVVARLERGRAPSYVVATVAGAEEAPIEARVHVVELDGSQRVWSRTHAAPHFVDGRLDVYRALLGEPRVTDVTGTPTREIVVPTIVGWGESVRGIEYRYGLVSELVRWSTTAGAVPIAVELPRERFPDRRTVAPLVQDLDGDQRAEWITARGSALTLLGSGTVDTAVGAWTDERGGSDRRGCFECRERVAVDVPETTSLLRPELEVHPNPFNPRTSIRLRVPRAGAVHWSVFDARGRRVREEYGRADGAGTVEWRFDATDDTGSPLASGVYHVVARWNARTAHARMVLVR